MNTATQVLTGERADLAEALAKQRGFIRYTTRGMSDDQAARRTTVSELCLGGIIKHVTEVERQWARFIVEGPSAMGGSWDDEGVIQDWLDGFRMLPGETPRWPASRLRASSQRDGRPDREPSGSGRSAASAGGAVV